jgi:hypothetical protein
MTTSFPLGVGRRGGGSGGVEGGRRWRSGGVRRARAARRRRARRGALGVVADVWERGGRRAWLSRTMRLREKVRVEGEGEIADGACRGGRTRGWMIYGEEREYGWKGAEAGCLVFREGLAVTAGALNSSVGRELNKYER